MTHSLVTGEVGMEGKVGMAERVALGILLQAKRLNCIVGAQYLGKMHQAVNGVYMGAKDLVYIGRTHQCS